MRRIRNARTAHASRWTARETSEQLFASVCVCVLSVIPTLGSNISSWLSGLCLPAPTLRIRSVAAINFLLYLNLFLATLSFSAQLVALQAAFALACSPSLLVYVFDLEGKKKQSQAKKNKVWQKFSLSTSKKICSSWLIY